MRYLVNFIVYFSLFSYSTTVQFSYSAEEKELTFKYSSNITLHTVIVTDDKDKTLGRAAEKSAELIRRLSEDVSANLRINNNLVELSGTDFTSDKLLTSVNRLNVQEHDIVLFFYFGHGLLNTSKNRIFPDLQLDEPVQYGEVLNILFRKEPRLLIAIADACNSPFDMANSGIPLFIDDREFRDDEYISPYLVNSYSRLFLESAGHFLISSAGTGEQAFYDLEKGGVYTNIFVTAVREQLRHYRASWGPTIELISPTLEYSEVLKNSKIEQLPLTVIAFKDLKHVHARMPIAIRDSEQEKLCESFASGQPSPECIESVFGIDGEILVEAGEKIPLEPLFFLNETALFGMSEFIRPENYSFELLAMAQRFYWGDGALAQDYNKAVSLVAHSHSLGNSEAAGVIGDMEIAKFEETNESKHLWSALDWYIEGYRNFGDKRAGANWIIYVYQYVNSKQHIEHAIELIKSDFFEDFEEILPELCKEGYVTACTRIE
ncbi:caspase family protein [Roseibium album]|uniref:caspase family protein n=1 Tax=Roseibium album TaxID=311410 RepID=UPI00391AF285